MRRAARRFINHMEGERGLSQATVRSFRHDLKKFIEFVETRYGKGMLPGDITPDMIQGVLEFLATTGYRKKNGPASRAKRLVTIRSMFRYFYREGLLGKDPTEGIKGPNVPYYEPQFLQKEEYGTLLRAAGLNPVPFNAARDQALLATFLGTGARLRQGFPRTG